MSRSFSGCFHRLLQCLFPSSVLLFHSSSYLVFWCGMHLILQCCWFFLLHMLFVVLRYSAWRHYWSTIGCWWWCVSWRCVDCWLRWLCFWGSLSPVLHQFLRWVNLGLRVHHALHRSWLFWSLSYTFLGLWILSQFQLRSTIGGNLNGKTIGGNLNCLIFLHPAQSLLLLALPSLVHCSVSLVHAHAEWGCCLQLAVETCYIVRLLVSLTSSDSSRCLVGWSHPWWCIRTGRTEFVPVLHRTYHHLLLLWLYFCR